MRHRQAREQCSEVFDGWLLTELSGAGASVLARREWDSGGQDRVLVPDRIMDVQQSGFPANPHTKADPLVAVGSPAIAEVTLDAASPSERFGERNRTHPFNGCLPRGVALPSPLPVVDWIARVDVVGFVASQRYELAV